MAESAIPVDLLNPGQVFACFGLMEAADILLGDTQAAFDWNEGTMAVFRVSAAGSVPPVERVMRFLEEAEAMARAPAESPNLNGWKATWGRAPQVDAVGSPFPFPDPNSPATLPVVLKDPEGHEIAIDHWGDATRRDNVKFWAGAGGKPAVAIMRDALNSVSGKMLQHGTDPFALSEPQTISFRFDWRRDYIPVHDGFSPNKHKKDIQMVGFPMVEVLAALGMAHARPCRKAKLEYKYAVLGCWQDLLLDPIFHRAALGAGALPVPGWPFRRFVMRLEQSGKDDRCITQVTEETTIQ